MRIEWTYNSVRHGKAEISQHMQSDTNVGFLLSHQRFIPKTCQNGYAPCAAGRPEDGREEKQQQEAGEELSEDIERDLAVLRELVAHARSAQGPPSGRPTLSLVAGPKKSEPKLSTTATRRAQQRRVKDAGPRAGGRR